MLVQVLALDHNPRIEGTLEGFIAPRLQTGSLAGIGYT